MPPIDKAKVGFPVIIREITMVSIVPIVLHEIDFKILRYDFSFIPFRLKKSPSGFQKGLVYIFYYITIIPQPPSEKLSKATYNT